MFAQVCAFVRVAPLTGTYVFICAFRPCRPLTEKDLCSSIYRMHHLHIFGVHPSACGLFCGGISSENQCCHGWMYAAPGSARVGSPTRGSHMSPIYMSPAGASSPPISPNLKARKHISQWAGPRRSSPPPNVSAAQGPNGCLFMKA